MMFRKDGSASAVGWTFHGAPPDNVELVGYSHESALSIGSGNSNQTTPKNILEAVRSTAARHQNNRALAAVGLSPPEWHRLFRALIEAESAFDPFALSPKGAIGLGQLMPETARQLGVNPHDMNQNLDGAARYFLAQLSKFGSVDLALAAYNAGPHRIDEYGGVPPFSETRTYIARINRLSGGIVRKTQAIASTTPRIRTTLHSAVVLD